MRMVTILLLVCMLLGTPDVAPATKIEAVAPVEPEPLAVVTHISGVVMLKPASADKAMQINSTVFLFENDEVSTGQAGEATLLQVNATAQRLTGNNRRIIKPLSPPPPRGAFTREQMSRFKQRYRGAVSNIPREPPRHKRKKKLLTLLTLRAGLLLDPRPILAWTPVRGVQTYFVRLLNNDNKVIWSQNTSEPRTLDAPALASGEYKWDVTATTKVDKPLYDFTVFTAVAGDQAEEIKKELQEAREVTGDSEGANLLYVELCLQYKQYRKAEDELKKGLRKTPSDTFLWALLTETYQAMERWDDREKAKKFFSNPKSSEKLRQFLSEKDAAAALQ